MQLLFILLCSLIISFFVGKYSARIDKVGYGVALSVIWPFILTFMAIQFGGNDIVYESAPMLGVLYLNYAVPFALVSLFFYLYNRKGKNVS